MTRRDRDDMTAGGTPPAAPVSGPLWRERHDQPTYRVTLWPNQSLTRRGYRIVLAVAAIGLALPVIGLAATGVVWPLLGFAAAAFLALRLAFRRNVHALAIEETLEIWRDEVRVERRDPDGRVRRWQADTARVRVRVYGDAKVKDYLTLSGGGREIELGAFLAPEERLGLADEIEAALTRALRP